MFSMQIDLFCIQTLPRIGGWLKFHYKKNHILLMYMRVSFSTCWMLRHVQSCKSNRLHGGGGKWLVLTHFSLLSNTTECHQTDVGGLIQMTSRCCAKSCKSFINRFSQNLVKSNQKISSTKRASLASKVKTQSAGCWETWLNPIYCLLHMTWHKPHFLSYFRLIFKMS